MLLVEVEFEEEVVLVPVGELAPEEVAADATELALETAEEAMEVALETTEDAMEVALETAADALEVALETAEEAEDDAAAAQISAMICCVFKASGVVHPLRIHGVADAVSLAFPDPHWQE